MEKDNKNIEIKIPAIIPIIIITVFLVVTAKIYSLNLNKNVEATNNIDNVEQNKKEDAQDEEREEIKKDDINVEDNNVVEEVVEEVVEKDIEIVNEEPKKVTYTAPNGKKYDAIATLNIPSLGIEYPILSSTSETLLKVALNKYWGANPNEVGNMVVLGHNYKNSKFFGKLHQIKKGAIVKITDLSGKTLDYKVYEKYVIDPNDNSCTSQLTNGQTEITLITCYYQPGDVHASKRFVVKARAN